MLGRQKDFVDMGYKISKSSLAIPPHLLKDDPLY